MMELGLYDAQRTIMETLKAYKDKVGRLSNSIGRIKSMFGERVIRDIPILSGILLDENVKVQLFEELDNAGYDCLLEMCSKLNKNYDLGTGLKDAKLNKNIITFKIESDNRNRNNISRLIINKDTKVTYKIKPAGECNDYKKDYTVIWNKENDRFLEKTLELVKNNFDSDPWDRVYRFNEFGEFNISAAIQHKTTGERCELKWKQHVYFCDDKAVKSGKLSEVRARYAGGKLNFYGKYEGDTDKTYMLLSVDASSSVLSYRRYPTKLGNNENSDIIYTTHYPRNTQGPVYPYVPAIFPASNNWKITGFEDGRGDSDIGPFKIVTDAHQEVVVWGWDSVNNTWKKNKDMNLSPEKVEDSGYLIHGGAGKTEDGYNPFGNNNHNSTTRGCIRIKNVDVLKIVSMFQKYLDEKGFIKLEAHY
ncbi:hypothetical protein EZS27_025351, partial [termite gut metagenome]